MNPFALIFILSLLLPNIVFAIDIAPYKVGQALTEEQAKELNQRKADREVQIWQLPSDSGKFLQQTDSIKYGYELLSKTNKYLGPKASNPNLRYSGNSLNCTSCHLAASGSDPLALPGTVKFAMPFVNVLNDYPSFRSRSMTIGSIEDRVDGCMERSQNGKKLPRDSKEMIAIVDYFKFLTQDAKVGQAMEGTGTISIKFPKRKANVVVGNKLFDKYCVLCHQAGGMGLKSATYSEDGSYTFPPLAGDDSFNDGAGMSRLKTTTKFIYANMPLGATADIPILTVDQAYDIAGYVKSLKRPAKAHREKDFPNPKFRTNDYAVPAYFKGDKDALDKATYGPFN